MLLDMKYTTVMMIAIKQNGLRFSILALRLFQFPSKMLYLKKRTPTKLYNMILQQTAKSLDRNTVLLYLTLPRNIETLKCKNVLFQS